MTTTATAERRERIGRAYHPTRGEQETVIRWDREEGVVHVWSASPLVWRRMARLSLAVARETHWPDGAVAGRGYTIPLDRFRWGLKATGRSGRPGGNPAALARARAAQNRPRSLQERGNPADTPTSDLGAGRESQPEASGP